ncbi:MAG: hypothetical protein QME61_02570 [Patescibacteria group bacterium]|nr:hypothetical protein [Patescibacteria group bacterium]
MPIWLVYGLLASLCWGTYAVVSKVVTSEKYLGIQPGSASLLMLGGITMVFMLYFLSRQGALSVSLKSVGILLIAAILGFMIYSLRQTGVQISLPTLGFGLLQGVLWASGMVFAFLAFSVGAEAAKLVPIYNTNTLIAVVLGLLLLREVPAPDERLKVIIGAILIVIGGVLVSK